MLNCPQCGSSRVIKNGTIHNGKPKFACKACGRQFVEMSESHRISEETKALVDRLLLERISLAGIVRATGVCRLVGCITTSMTNMPTCPKWSTCLLKKRRLTVQCDELWSFVGNKANQVWLWLAMDAETRLIVSCAIGPRDVATAEDLWHGLPPEYRQCAVCFRLVPIPLSLSKKLRNHIGAIWYFVHDYNARICAQLGLNSPSA